VISPDAVKKMLRRGAQMRADRTNHEHVWSDCFDLSFPERGTGLSGSNLPQSAGDIERKKVQMVDSTGRDALKTLCAGLVGGLVPSNQQWAELDAGRENDVEKLWLSEAAQTVWENIHNSNFDAEIMDAMYDIGPAGWFVLYVDEAEEGGYQFECWPIAECFLGQSRKAGPVDIVHRCYQCSVEQLVATFGKSGVSAKVLALYDEGKFDEKIDVIRMIQPRRASNGFLARNMPYESITLESQTEHVLRESGYHEFPAIAPRWARLPNSVYATGPFLDALGDVRTLNRLVAGELSASEIAVYGMWIGKADGILNPGALKLGAKKVIAAADTDNLKALSTGADFNVTWTLKDALQRQIRHTLMADQLQPQDKPDMTAFEVHTRVQMIRQLLGPVFGRFQAEFLTPLVERCFGLAYRAGVLGEMPMSLRERAYTVRYKSPLARAQRLEEVTAIQQSLSDTGLLAEAKGDMGVWDVIDTDEAQRALYEGRGVPLRLLKKQADVDAVREARAAEAERQRKQMQTEEMQAQAIKQTARA
jgi:hypothetical protein